MAQRVSKHKRSYAIPKKDHALPPEKNRVSVKAAFVKPKQKTKTKAEEKETPDNPQKALRAAQAKIRQERQARVKAEKALAEVQNFLATSLPQTSIKRVSFVVRLVIDKDNQLGRTEIEHVPSGRKQNFLNPNGERLMAFIEACVRSTYPTGNAIPGMHSPEQTITTTLEPSEAKHHLIVQDVLIHHLDSPNSMSSILSREEAFLLEACFQFQGVEPQHFPIWESTFEIKLFGKETNGRRTKLLTTYRAELVRDVLEYKVPIEVPGLQVGLYCLSTVVTLDGPTRVGGFHRDIINVI